MVSIAVLTPSLPGRADLLAEAMASVHAQSRTPTSHVVGIDYDRVGIGRMLNQLASSAEADWLARLDDDDLFMPAHLEVLARTVDDADVIYTWCEVKPRSRDGVVPPVPAVLGPAGWIPNQEFDANLLRERNYIPATTLIRKSLWCEIGGWTLPGWGVGDSPREPEFAEDWNFWLRALEAGARFLCIPEVTWTYRYHGENVWFK
jgi:Glycosyltransferase like family 2